MAINYIYHPVLLSIGPVNIYTWGLIVAIGFFVGIMLAARYGKKIGLKEDTVYGLCFYILLGGVLGARILFVITNFGTYIDDPLGIFKVWNGGMDFVGGLAGGILGAYVFVKIKKLSVGTYFDLVAPYIALGHAIGRLGCVLGDGGHLGKPTNLPWGITYEGVARHPTALYEMLLLVGLFIFLIKVRKKNMEKGMLFISYVMGYSVLRFGLDFLRDDPLYYGLTGTQWGLILAVLISGFFMYRIKKKAKKPAEQPKQDEKKEEIGQQN
ncbi:MAG: prolipoprotein diacylglyceryl transferase [Candidatus Nanoarchaeia archaeon]